MLPAVVSSAMVVAEGESGRMITDIVVRPESHVRRVESMLDFIPNLVSRYCVPNAENHPCVDGGGTLLSASREFGKVVRWVVRPRESELYISNAPIMRRLPYANLLCQIHYEGTLCTLCHHLNAQAFDLDGRL